MGCWRVIPSSFWAPSCWWYPLWHLHVCCVQFHSSHRRRNLLLLHGKTSLDKQVLKNFDLNILRDYSYWTNSLHILYLEKRMLQWLRCSWSFTRIPHTHSLPQTQVNQLQSHSILLRSKLSQTYLYIFHIFHLLSYEMKQFTLQFKVEVERDITYKDQINGFRLAVGIKWERWVDDNYRDAKKDKVRAQNTVSIRCYQHMTSYLQMK